MRHSRLENMTRGWFVGDFSPTVLSTQACEVAIKRFAAGEHEATHHHRIATEVTAVVSGRVRMAGLQWEAGAIITIEPREATDFLALEDSVIVVVKLPCAPADKYPGPDRA